MKAPTLSSTTNADSCFPWSDSLTLCVFEKSSARYPSLNDHSLKKWCSMGKKVVSSTCNSKQLHKCFSLRWPPCFVVQKCFMCTSNLVTQNVKKMCIRVLRFNKTNNFYWFKDIFKWNQCMAVKNTVTARIVWCHLALIHVESPLLLHHQSKYQYSEKGK